MGISNVTMSDMRYILGCIDYLHLGINSILTCFFVFDYNISHYNVLKMKKELFVFVLISFFITLSNLVTQIRGAQTRYTVVNFGLNQRTNENDFKMYQK